MSTVDLPPRLAGENRPGARETIMFDQKLPRWDGAVASSSHGTTRWSLPGAPSPGGEPRRRRPQAEGGPDLAGVLRRIRSPFRASLEAL